MALDRRKIASALQRELPKYQIDNPDAHRCAGIIWSDVVAHVKALKKEWVAEAKKAEAERVSVEEVPMTRDELIKYLAKSVKGGNTQAGKLLSDLEGFEKASSDLRIEMVNYSDAPEHFFVSKPPDNVK